MCYASPKHGKKLSISFPLCLFLAFSQPFRRDQPSTRGGGVAIYVRRGLAAHHITPPSSGLECTALRINLPQRKYLEIVVSYRPPDVVSDFFLDSLEEVITPHLSANLCILGDCNVKNSSWFSGQVTDGPGTALKELADACDLKQVVDQPTYNVTTKHPSLLDIFSPTRPSVFDQAVFFHRLLITAQSLLENDPTSKALQAKPQSISSTYMRILTISVKMCHD